MLYLMSSRSELSVVLHQHLYQPLRQGSHDNIAGLGTDPKGEDWTDIISMQCYLPQLQAGIFEYTSLDCYPGVRHHPTIQNSPETLALKQALRDRGVGDPFLHVLLPDLNKQDKQILVGAGLQAFFAETGKQPLWFWAPETALDFETVEVLSSFGYRGVICAPEQIDTNGFPDNRPIRIKIQGDGYFLALPFDTVLSKKLAFGNKSNADHFTRDYIKGRYHGLSPTQPLIGSTDGETFGHHDPGGVEFLQYLFEVSLQESNITPVGINNLLEIWSDADYSHGRLINRSAWSCPHGDLVRWHDACPCDNGHHGGWKYQFSHSLRRFNTGVTLLVNEELGNSWPETLIQNFADALYYRGSQNTTLSLLAAKASALAAQTSCGTFFEDPGTSGAINFLFARQAAEHLSDAAYPELAHKLLWDLRQELSYGIDPKTKKPLNDLFDYYLKM